MFFIKQPAEIKDEKTLLSFPLIFGAFEQIE